MGGRGGKGRQTDGHVDTQVGTYAYFILSISMNNRVKIQFIEEYTPMQVYSNVCF